MADIDERMRLVAEDRRRIANEWSCKNTKNDSVLKPAEWCLGKTDSIPMCACGAK